MTTLSDIQAQTIIDRANDGERQVRLAEEYGVSEGLVSKLVSGASRPHLRRPLDDRICVTCGVSIAGRLPAARYCSQRCIDAPRIVRLKQARAAARRELVCCICGASRSDKATQSKYCDDCASERIAEDRYAAMHKRRAKLRAAAHERINRREIYIRDGGKCHICGRRVASDAFHLDHLIPAAFGGPTIASNLRVAHGSCNQSRGAGRLPAQLLLVG